MRIIITIIALLFSQLSIAQIQEEQPETSDSCSKFPILENLYIEGSLGLQILYSQDVENLDRSDRLTPSFSLAAGTWINHFFGASLKFQGASLNGFSTTEGIYSAADPDSPLFEQDPVRKEVTINPDGTYRHFIRYINMSANVFISLANLYSITPGQKKFDLIPSVGIGNMHVFRFKGIPSKNTLSYNIGLSVQYHLNNLIAVNTGCNMVFFNNDFEGRIAGQRDKEKYASANIGIVYHFKERVIKTK